MGSEQEQMDHVEIETIHVGSISSLFLDFTMC